MQEKYINKICIKKKQKRKKKVEDMIDRERKQ